MRVQIRLGGGTRRELSRSIELCLETLALVQEKVGRLAFQLGEFALSKAAGRVSRMIIRQFELQEVPLRNGAKASIPSQKLMAQMMGASRETANKELNLLRRTSCTFRAARQHYDRRRAEAENAARRLSSSQRSAGALA